LLISYRGNFEMVQIHILNSKALNIWHPIRCLEESLLFSLFRFILGDRYYGSGGFAGITAVEHFVGTSGSSKSCRTVVGLTIIRSHHIAKVNLLYFASKSCIGLSEIVQLIRSPTLKVLSIRVTTTQNSPKMNTVSELSLTSKPRC
jgi:hypothetical protein